MRYLFILLLILSKQLLGTTSHYQKIDSLKKLLVQNKIDTISIDLKNQISMVYFRLQNNDSSLLFTKEAINDAKKINYLKGLVTANLNMASISTRQGFYPNALKYCFEAQNILGINGDKKLLAKSNLKIGLIYYYEEKNKEALKYFQIAFKQSEQSADLNGQAEALGNMAIIYRIIGDYNKSILFYEQTLDKFNELLNIAQKENNKSDINKSKFGISNCIGNIGFLLESQNKYDEAIANYNKAIEIENEINSEENAAIHHNNLANVYLKKKNFREAQHQLETAYKIASKTNAPDILRDYYFSLSQLDSALGNYNKAFVHRKLFFAYRDSLINTENLEKTVQAQMQFEFDKKEAISKSEQDKKNAIAKKETERQKAVRNSFILGFILVLIIAITVYRNLKRNQKAKEIIERQKLILEVKNKEILDSIHYAKRIQFTLLATESILKNNLKKHFILFQPKDIVSGDFYWAATKDEYFYLAVCDSTGHGVPGALMSVLNTTFLNEAINEKNIVEANEILNYLRMRLIATISSDGAQDGMDCTLFCYNKKEPNLIKYAAANHRPILVNDNEILELEGDKMPVGNSDNLSSFTLYTINRNSSSKIYLFTDGYADQFGGAKDKKFSKKQLRELLISIANEPFDKQHKILLDTYNSWKGEKEQIDDVCMIGLEI